MIIGRKAQNFFMPLFFITILLMLTLALGKIILPDFDDLRIGEGSEDIFDGIHRAEGVKIYADLAVKNAVKIESSSLDAASLDERITTRYNRFMASHPLEVLPSTFSMSVDADGKYFSSNEEVIIVLGKTKKTPPVSASSSAAGILQVWPSSQDVFVTSLFGKRDVGTGSSNHPGMDIRASLGTDILAVADGDVFGFSYNDNGEKYWYVSHTLDNGWVCEYFHVTPLDNIKNAHVHVNRGDVIAKVAKEIYAPHLDLRCYHPELTEYNKVNSLFGANHIGNSDKPPADTTYAAHDSEMVRVYIDPYCLFSKPLKDKMLASVISNKNGLSGLQTRSGTDIPEKMEETCQAYRDSGLLSGPGVVASGSDAFVDVVIENTLKHEGGFVNDPDDPGGATNYGITIQVYRDYKKDQSLTPVDVEAMELEEAIKIYKQNYFYGPGVDKLPTALIPLCYDMTVHHGGAGGPSILQDALDDLGYNAPDDNKYGSDTVAIAQQAIDEHGVQKTIDAIVDSRLRYMDNDIKNNPKKEKYRNGWESRANDFRDLELIDDIDVAVRKAGPQATLRFPLTARVFISQENSQKARSIGTVISHLKDCPADDVSCSENALNSLPVDFKLERCSNYFEQLYRVINNCRPYLDSGCSCALPVPPDYVKEVSFSIDQVKVIIDDSGSLVSREFSPDWFSYGEDFPDNDPRRMAFDSGSLIRIDGASWSRQTPKILSSINGVLPFTNWIWFRLEGDSLIFGSPSVACTSGVPVSYCSGEDVFWVSQDSPSVPRPVAVPDS